MDSEGQPARSEPRALGVSFPELLWKDGSGVSRGTSLTERTSGLLGGPSLLGESGLPARGSGPGLVAGTHWVLRRDLSSLRRLFSVFCFSLSFDEDEDDLEEEHVTKVRGYVLGFLCDWAWEKGSPSDLLTQQAGLRPGASLLGAAWACVPQGIEEQPFWAQARVWGRRGHPLPLGSRAHPSVLLSTLSFAWSTVRHAWCPRFPHSHIWFPLC